jgi:hypothetical protein
VLQIGRQNSLVESGYLYPGIEQAIDEQADWDAEEGVDAARTGGLTDPNAPETIEHAAKTKAKFAPKPAPPAPPAPPGKPAPPARPNSGSSQRP